MGLIIYSYNTAVYFVSFGIEYIPQEVSNKIRDESINHNIFRTQDNESIMCGFDCVAFIEYKLAGKTLLDYANLFSSNHYKRMTKKYVSILKINMVEEANLEFRLRKIDETRN